jgi:hypothetical protein
VYTTRDEPIDTWLTERSSGDEAILEEQFQVIARHLERGQP